MKKKILIIFLGKASSAPRLLKQVRSLHKHYHLTIATDDRSTIHLAEHIFLPSNIKGDRIPLNFHFKYPFLIKKIISLLIKIFYLNTLSLENKIEFEFWNKNKHIEFYNILSKIDYNLVLIHHLSLLPLAKKLSDDRDVPLILNAHEYYPREFDQNENWNKISKKGVINLCNSYFKYVDLMYTVNDSIKKEYLKEFKIDSIVIRNDKPFYDLYPIKNKFNHIKIVHHGAAIREREIERMINVMNYLPNNFTLFLMLVPTDLEYYNELKEKISHYLNIKLVDPVSTEQIPLFLNQFDIGIYILPPKNFNLINALPNKFFEFVQARLAIITSPNKEMKFLIEKYNLGGISKDYSPRSMAIEILKLKDIIFEKKMNVHKSALELSSEKSDKIVLKSIKKIIKCAE